MYLVLKMMWSVHAGSRDYTHRSHLSLGHHCLGTLEMPLSYLVPSLSFHLSNGNNNPIPIYTASITEFIWWCLASYNDSMNIRCQNDYSTQHALYFIVHPASINLGTKLYFISFICLWGFIPMQISISSLGAENL